MFHIAAQVALVSMKTFSVVTMHLSRNTRFTMPPRLPLETSLVLSSHIRGVDEMKRTSNQEHDHSPRRAKFLSFTPGVRVHLPFILVSGCSSREFIGHVRIRDSRIVLWPRWSSFNGVDRLSRALK